MLVQIVVNYFLLLEDGGYLLYEDGTRIIIDTEIITVNVNRLWNVLPDDRVYEPNPDDRVYIVPNSDRVYEVS